jgi:hypothetical protein
MRKQNLKEALRLEYPSPPLSRGFYTNKRHAAKQNFPRAHPWHLNMKLSSQREWKRRTEKKFLDIHLRKDSSLLLHAFAPIRDELAWEAIFTFFRKKSWQGTIAKNYWTNLFGKASFDFKFLSWISFPLAPEYPIGAIKRFYINFAQIFATLYSSPVSTKPARSCSQGSTTPA